MRASIYVLGPLLARFGAARVSLPGGCAWGPRPVNLHLQGLQAMNAQLEIEHGYIVGNGVQLRGAHFHFDVVSAWAPPRSCMMAATLAEGTTVLENVAIEPDITVLGQVLAACGAQHRGAGHAPHHDPRRASRSRPIDTTIIADRIEAATFAAAAAMTGGTITLEHVRARSLRGRAAQARGDRLHDRARGGRGHGDGPAAGRAPWTSPRCRSRGSRPTCRRR